MGFRCTRPGYSVSVEGLLLAETRFVIQAAIDYDPLLPEDDRERLVPRARLEALLAIEGQEEHARRLGVREVRIGVVGDPALHRFFRDAAPRSAPSVRAARQVEARVPPSLHA